MAEERIQKIMAEQGLCSRRAAEQIIAEGRVKVNGHPVKVGDKMDPNRDVLHVDDALDDILFVWRQDDVA